MISATRARTIIGKLSRSRYRHNADIMELCRLLALAMDLGDDIASPAKPPRSLYHENPRLYVKAYMRWWRHQGQIGKAGNQYKSETVTDPPPKGGGLYAARLMTKNPQRK